MVINSINYSFSKVCDLLSVTGKQYTTFADVSDTERTHFLSHLPSVTGVKTGEGITHNNFFKSITLSLYYFWGFFLLVKKHTCCLLVTGAKYDLGLLENEPLLIKLATEDRQLGDTTIYIN